VPDGQLVPAWNLRQVAVQCSCGLLSVRIGGEPGRGGGSSITLFVWDATVVVTGGTLAAGDGGNGGDGGPGSVGESGLRPPAPEGMACPLDCFPDAEGCGHSNQVVVEGIPATAGGRGSDGARGGSGAGGDSYAVYQGGEASVTLEGTVLIAGRAGVGGYLAPDGTAAHSNR
jgi:hypothetical protein